MSKKYIYIHDLTESENHAGYKARHDIFNILKKRKEIEVVKVPLSIGGIFERISSVIAFMKFLNNCRQGEHLVFNYPLAKPYGKLLEIMTFFRSFNFSLIVHDLNSLRKKQAKEDTLIYKATNIISHNKTMTSYMKDIGVENINIIELNLFDYLHQCDSQTRNIEACVDITLLIAGNLSKEKAGYLYSWEPTFPVDIYGINYNGTSEKLNYHGVFDADNPGKLMSMNKSYYGLVWDGDSQLTCSGMFGEYLKYNNPHKASLYLSLSIPVVVWSGSALAEFVRREKCGVVIDNLNELEHIIRNKNQWEHCRVEAERLSLKISNGDFLGEALKKFE
ncbi:hypothetical protein [Scandinavium lactucae]|uniref:Beta-1,6-galactofuranosyltransferase n=1 Tax=Scandinavium lactucae TaxID=3095028 RepID=A0ABU4QMS3_9ENTR|nr:MULTISPECIES: hypothetical protein [unclassified Scandinavium]MDX6040105.1 hypothetical protein [Scandinavium sp. V105_6]MDX6050904.1 hypothetical protein [Scandinavium sp. V105_1]